LAKILNLPKQLQTTKVEIQILEKKSSLLMRLTEMLGEKLKKIFFSFYFKFI
jgi:hypothetical protein